MLCPRKGAILVLKEFIKQNIGGTGCYSEKDFLESTSLAPTLVSTPLYAIVPANADLPRTSDIIIITSTERVIGACTNPLR